MLRIRERAIADTIGVEDEGVAHTGGQRYVPVIQCWTVVGRGHVLRNLASDSPTQY